MASGVAGAVADASAVTRAVTGIVDAGAVASVVDAGGVAGAVADAGTVTGAVTSIVDAGGVTGTVVRRVAGVVPGILSPGQAVEEVGGGGGQSLSPRGDVVGHALQHASHLVGGTDQWGFAQRLQGDRAATDGDGFRAVGPVAGCKDNPGERRVAPAPTPRGVQSAVVVPGILGPPPVGVASGLRVGVPHLGLQLGREQGHHPLDG